MFISCLCPIYRAERNFCPRPGSLESRRTSRQDEKGNGLLLRALYRVLSMILKSNRVGDLLHAWGSLITFYFVLRFVRRKKMFYGIEWKDLFPLLWGCSKYFRILLYGRVREKLSDIIWNFTRLMTVNVLDGEEPNSI